MITDCETSYEKDFKKRREEERTRIKELKKKYPNNKVIQEMDEDVKEEKMADQRSKRDHFSLIRKAMYAAEELYTREGKDFKEVTTDLTETIKSCQEAYKE